MSKSSNQIQGFALAILGAAMFSSKAILVKLSYEIHVDTMSLLFMRMGYALPIYAVIAIFQFRKKRVTDVSKQQWLILLFIGIVGYYLASFLDFWGLQYISAGLERLILFLYPTMTVLLTALIFKRKILRQQILAILIAYVGIAVAFWEEATSTQNENFLLGATLVFFSALSFSFYLVGSEGVLAKLGVLKFTSYCMIISCIAVMIHYNLVSETSVFDLSWKAHALGFSVAMFNTVIPSFIISAAISKIGAAKTSVLSSIGPVFVIFAAAMFLKNEEITLLKLVGAGVVILGILYLSQSKSKNKW